MAAPNIINVTSVIPHTVSISPADVARNSLVAAPSTNQAHKINTIIVANVDESTAYNCTVELLLTDGTTYRPIANTVTVPAKGTLTVLDKTKSLYLFDTSVTGEAVSIHATTESANKLTFTCSYETLS